MELPLQPRTEWRIGLCCKVSILVLMELPLQHGVVGNETSNAIEFQSLF